MYLRNNASDSKTTWKNRAGQVDQTWLMPAQGEATQAQGHANNAQKARLAQFFDVSCLR